MIRHIWCPIHREGFPFIVIFALVSLCLHWVYEPLGWLSWMLTAWCVFFFRDPYRVSPTRAGLIVSPADGVIQSIGPALPPRELNIGDVPVHRISIFMNVFNVHVNRVPVSGIVTATHYFPGKFLNAALDKASEENERNALTMKTPSGEYVGIVQIAGLIARRIICYAHPGEEFAVGDRFGIIRFGSRVDVYLPLGVAPSVLVGQKTIAGETILADILSTAEVLRDGRRS